MLSQSTRFGLLVILLGFVLVACTGPEPVVPDDVVITEPEPTAIESVDPTPDDEPAPDETGRDTSPVADQSELS